MNIDNYRFQGNKSPAYILFRLCLAESFYFIKFILRRIIKWKKVLRDPELVNSIYDKRRGEQLQNYEFTTSTTLCNLPTHLLVLVLQIFFLDSLVQWPLSVHSEQGHNLSAGYLR